MARALATDLRDGFQRVSEVLAEGELDLLARARDSLYRSRAERDRLLAGIVLAYQRGPRQLWAPVLLDLIAPALVDSVRRFRPQPPFADEDDVRQQLVFELLRAAAQMPVHPYGRRMRLRLISQARKEVIRWLDREAVRQGRQLALAEQGLR